MFRTVQWILIAAHARPESPELHGNTVLRFLEDPYWCGCSLSHFRSSEELSRANLCFQLRVQ